MKCMNIAGFFGSNVALLLRRFSHHLARIKASPQFFLATATCANPEEHASNLIRGELPRTPPAAAHLRRQPDGGMQIAPIGAGVLAVNGLLLRPRAAPHTGAQAHGSRQDRTRSGPEPRQIGNDRRVRPA